MLYAAYGSNLHPLRLSKRVSSAKLIGTSYLPNWSLRFHKRSIDESGKCSIVSGGPGVYVAIFDLSFDDKATLDRIEGVGSGYTATSLQLPDFGDCESYVAQDSHIDDSLAPYDWYKELVLIGARTHGFPDSYIERIRAISTRPDPDPHRRAERWSVVDLVKAGDANAL